MLAGLKVEVVGKPEFSKIWHPILTESGAEVVRPFPLFSFHLSLFSFSSICLPVLGSPTAFLPPGQVEWLFTDEDEAVDVILAEEKVRGEILGKTEERSKMPEPIAEDGFFLKRLIFSLFSLAAEQSLRGRGQSPGARRSDQRVGHSVPPLPGNLDPNCRLSLSTERLFFAKELLDGHGHPKYFFDTSEK